MSTVTQAERKTVTIEANGSRINGSADVVDDHLIHKSRAADEIDRPAAPASSHVTQTRREIRRNFSTSSSVSSEALLRATSTKGVRRG